MGINNYPLIFKKQVISYKINNNAKTRDIISIFDISKSSLFAWYKLYQNNELTEKKAYIKKSKFTSVIRHYIQNYVCTRVNFYYVNLIKLIKKKFSVSISKSSLYRILHNIKITRKKIRKKIILKSKKNHNRDIKLFKKKIKSLISDKIICIDETSIDTYLSANYGWSKRGTIITEIKKKQRIRYTAISAISKNKVIYNKYIKGSANALHFLQFIIDTVKITGNDKYFLLDNARIHHANMVNKYVNENDIQFIYNVPYCPEYNPIENVFSQVKQIIKMKKNNQKQLLKNVTNAFKKVTKQDLHKYYKNSLNF